MSVGRRVCEGCPDAIGTDNPRSTNSSSSPLRRLGLFVVGSRTIQPASDSAGVVSIGIGISTSDAGISRRFLQRDS